MMPETINGKPRREYYRDYMRNWISENKERYYQYMRPYNRQRNAKLKQELFCFLCNDKPKCRFCGFSDIRALQIDHINGGGAKERREHFGNKCNMYHYYYEHLDEARQKLQVLCANCNWIKRWENKECQQNHTL